MERPSKRPRTALVEEPDPSYGLVRDRHRNDNRLKGAFENIFLKYTKDFTNVGDEIDLQTGEIVVDNGHISRMRDEQDVGEGEAGAILRAFAEDMVDSLSDGEDTEEPQNGAIVEARLNQNIEDPATCDDDAHDEAVQPTIAGESSARSQAQGDSQVVRAAPVGRQKPDAAAIEALGRSIGMQIAQFIGQWQCSAPALDSLWSAPPLPQRTPHRRDVSESLLSSQRRRPVSPPTGSLWAVPDPATGARPIQPVSRRLASERRSLFRDDATPHMDSHGEDQDYASDEDDDEEDNKETFSTYLDRSRQYSANTSAKRAGSGRKSRHHFSEEDNSLLLELKEEHQFPWATICSYWPDRPPWIVQHHYHKHLKNRNPNSADSTNGQPDEADDQPGEPAVDKERATSRASESSQDLFPQASENSIVTGPPVESPQHLYRKTKPQSIVALSRSTTANRASPDSDHSDLGTPTAQGTADRFPNHLVTSNERDAAETTDSQESIESRSSPEILDSVEPAIVPKSHSARKKPLENSGRKSIDGMHPRLSSSNSNTRTSLGRHTPRAVKATPRVEKAEVVDDESDDEISSSPASNLVNISNIVASPRTLRHRKQTSGRSGTISKSRRVSDVRVSSKSQYTPSRSSGLKRPIEMYDDDDDSLDELALI